jgi:hypothetical protein
MCAGLFPEQNTTHFVQLIELRLLLLVIHFDGIADTMGGGVMILFRSNVFSSHNRVDYAGVPCAPDRTTDELYHGGVESIAF